MMCYSPASLLLILAIDCEYRRQADDDSPEAGAGITRWITPRRFNPEQEP
jgi:hypothetical protein